MQLCLLDYLRYYANNDLSEHICPADSQKIAMNKPPCPQPLAGHLSLVLGLLLSSALALVITLPAQAQPQPASALASYQLQAGGGQRSSSFDGVVEAVRQTVLAAQVAGAIVQIEVKAGDRVRQGQVLLRVDGRAAQDAAQASEAQAQSARATLQLATRDFERQQQLFKQRYISQAALDQAESQFKATQAQVNAQLAQVGGARTQTSLHIVRSPYDGIVSELPVALGDMALPGRPLITVYDPSALRVTANLPQSVVASLSGKPKFNIDLNGQTGIQPGQLQILPTVDASSHTVQVRLDLPKASSAGLTPGLFARVWLSDRAASAASQQLLLPRSAVLRRAELQAVYVLNEQGQPLLRQVRLGEAQGELVEVLSGLSAGERVATDPAAAARALGSTKAGATR